jgi:hypothetical protein
LNKPPDESREDPLLRLVASEIELALASASLARRSHCCRGFGRNDFAITKALSDTLQSFTAYFNLK